MSPNPVAHGFEETAEVPRGRKAREVGEHVLVALEDSAKRGVAFTKTATPDEIDELRRDLGAAKVRSKYEVTVGTERLSETAHKLTFSARHRANGTAPATDIPPQSS